MSPIAATLGMYFVIKNQSNDSWEGGLSSEHVLVLCCYLEGHLLLFHCLFSENFHSMDLYFFLYLPDIVDKVFWFALLFILEAVLTELGEVSALPTVITCADTLAFTRFSAQTRTPTAKAFSRFSCCTASTVFRGWLLGQECWRFWFFPYSMLHPTVSIYWNSAENVLKCVAA